MSNTKVTFNRKIKGAIQLFRPELSFAAGICVMAGEIIALGSLPSIQNLFYGFICGFFISSSALILNDYFDLEVDRINAPNRPLPAGIISTVEVIVLTIVTTVIGFVASAIISIYALIVSIILWIIGVLYNWKLKETGLLGNFMVSFSVAITFILGGFIVGDPWNEILIPDTIIILSVLKLLRSRTSEEGHLCIKQIYRGALFLPFVFIISQLLFECVIWLTALTIRLSVLTGWKDWLHIIICLRSNLSARTPPNGSKMNDESWRQAKAGVIPGQNLTKRKTLPHIGTGQPNLQRVEKVR